MSASPEAAERLWRETEEWCPGPANVCSHACLAIGQTMPGIVGIFTQQIL